jgi:hypothetical protein
MWASIRLPPSRGNKIYMALGTPAGVDLGLADQLANETEEERKKRLALEAQRRALGAMATPFGAAAPMLGFGARGGGGGGGY